MLLKGKARGWGTTVPKAFPLRGRCPEGNFAFGKVGLAKGQTATAQIEDLRRGTEAPDEVDSRSARQIPIYRSDQTSIDIPYYTTYFQTGNELFVHFL